jgi:hypothetical protein
MQNNLFWIGKRSLKSKYKTCFSHCQGFPWRSGFFITQKAKKAIIYLYPPPNWSILVLKKIRTFTKENYWPKQLMLFCHTFLDHFVSKVNLHF